MSAPPFTLDRYREIVRAGLDAGYRFGFFDEIDAARRSGELVCLLRHDCDNDLTAAARLAAAEAALGVRSTWFVMTRAALYNLWAPTNVRLVRDILAMGHRLGLHFDESPHAGADAADIAAAVDRERGWLEDEFGTPVDATSFHQPSRRVLDQQIKINGLNTYDQSDMAGFHYMSDSNMAWRAGCPSQALRERRHPRLHLLSHPEWWTPQPMERRDKWRAMLANNLALMQDSLTARESTFDQPFAVTFADEPPPP